MNKKVAEAINEATKAIDETKKAGTVAMLDTGESGNAPVYASRPVGSVSFSVGTIMTSANVSFSFGPRAEDFHGAFPKVGGRSSVYGRDSQFVKYTNGDVYRLDNFAQENGFAAFSGGKVTSTGKAKIGLADVDTIKAAFQSASIRRDGGVKTDEDTFMKVAPVLDMDVVLKSCERGTVSVFSQYAFYNMDHSSARLATPLSGRSNSVTYYGIDLPGAQQDRLFFDPRTINSSPSNANPHFMDPSRKSWDIRTRSHADIDLQQHQFALGGRCAMPFRCGEIFAGAGATLNLLDYDFHATDELWIGGSRVATHRVSTSDQEVQFGVAAEGGMRFPITSRCSVEGAFRFDWVDPVTIGKSTSHVEIGGASYGARLGLRFDF